MFRYEKAIFSHIVNHCDQLYGRVIIDIAGAPTSLNRHLLSEGVSEIHSINIRKLHAGDGFIPEGYFHHIADARDINADVPQADIVLAVCALEHIPDLPRIIQSAFAKLKSKGILIMHGGSLWPCMLGHHVWVTADQCNYFFGQKTDPFPPWGHLSHTEAQLRELFDVRGIPKSHTELIMEQVYLSKAQNRLSVSTLRQLFASSGQLLLGFHESRWGAPNSRIFSQIRSRGLDYSDDDLMTGELIVIMQKL